MMTHENRIAMIDKLIEAACDCRTGGADGAVSMRLTQSALNAAHAYKLVYDTPMRRPTEESI
jgi:hypothetical protein